MIYLVSNQSKLFSSPNYEVISAQESLRIMKDWDLIQFDTETKGLDPHLGTLLTLQFGNKEGSIQIVVDCEGIDPCLYKEILESRTLILQNAKFDLRWLFNHKIIPTKIFDTMIAEQALRLGYPKVGTPGGIGYSLAAIAQRRIGIDLDKTIRSEINTRGLDESVILYAAEDVKHLYPIACKQIKEAKRTGQTKVLSIENAFIPAISYLEWGGIKLNADKWRAKMDSDESKLVERTKELNSWVINWYNEHRGEGDYIILTHLQKGGNINFDSFEYVPVSKPYLIGDIKAVDCKIPFLYKKNGVIKNKFIIQDTQGDLFTGFNAEKQCNINWNSSEQVIYFLKLLGFNTLTRDKKTGKNKDSCSEKVIGKQKGINDEFLKRYLDYQESSKVVNTYGQTYLNSINPKTGRIHTVFKQLEADTGRMACGSTKEENKDLASLIRSNLLALPRNRRKCTYPQLQNLPKDPTTRSCFVPNEGNLMTSADFSALESRLGADIYNEQSMIDEYLTGSGDIHSLTAKHIFKELADIDVKDIKRLRPDLRDRAKPVEFSQQFGGTSEAIRNALGCSKEESEQIATNYNEGFKGIAEYKEKSFKLAKERGYVLMCEHTGHRVHLKGWKEWVRLTHNDDFWDNYEALKNSTTFKDFKETEAYKTYSRINKEVSKWSRQSLNAPTQGSGIVILKMAVTDLFNIIVEKGWFGKVFICNLVHDEVVIEYPKELPEVEQILVDCMEKAAAKICLKLPIPAEASTGDHWIH